MNLKIQVFANLKDYFDREFTMDVPEGSNVAGLLELVGALNPRSAELLNKCRVAVNEEFVDGDTVLHADGVVILLPPSSGG
jgi:molybdopterin converting factor small subunit